MQGNKPQKRHWRFRWMRLVLFMVLVGIVIPVLGLLWGYHSLKTEAKTLKLDYHTRNYAQLSADVTQLSGTIGAMRNEFFLMGWMDAIPVIRGYYLNGMDLLTAGHIYLDAVSRVLPPILNAGAKTGLSSQQKGALLNQTVSQAGITIASMAPQFQAANRSIQLMNPQRIPGVLVRKGLDVAALKTVSDTILRIVPAMSGPHPIFASLLGFPNPVRYLLIFQNSGELRSTGGFMTAYAYVPFSHGKLGKITSQNIQNLDSKVTYHPPAPTVIGAYLPVKYWHLRDANTSPDVPQTVANIKMFYNSIPGAPPINGVAFIDTWFVDSLIADVGSMNVPTVRGTTVHITPQNANYEMEKMAEGMGLSSNRRKLFIGTMMKQLLHDAFHGHTSTLLKVAASVRTALDHKQILLYFDNKQAESFVVQHHWGGTIPQKVNGNYIQVVDENLLGHKDNYYVRESYQVKVTPVNGRNLETVTIHWIDPAIVNWWLTVPYHSWVRVYAPMGSKFISMTGIDSYAQVGPNTALNKEVFGGHVDLPGRFNKSQPPSQGTVTVKFWLPSGVNLHRMLVQKQPGMLAEPVTVTIHGITRHFLLNSHQWLAF